MIEICDIHSHVLPEIDDGAKNWNMSLDMIFESWNHGVRKVIATPHFIPWKVTTAPRQIEQLCLELQKRVYRELGFDMKIYPGQEIYYHYDIIEHLKHGDIQTMAGSRYVLVEFDEEAAYKNIVLGVRSLRKARYRPVLAHVERYSCLRERGRLEELSNAGALLQMNSISLTGGIFDRDCSWCKKMLLKHRIDYIASDMHNLSNRPPISIHALSWMQKKLNEEYCSAVLSQNGNFLLV